MWDIVTVVLVLYCVVSVPYHVTQLQCFLRQGKAYGRTTGELAFEYAVVDGFFVCDIALKWTRFAVVDNGFIVKRKTEIQRRYRRGPFAREVLASLPTDLLALLAGSPTVFLLFPLESPFLHQHPVLLSFRYNNNPSQLPVFLSFRDTTLHPKP